MNGVDPVAGGDHDSVMDAVERFEMVRPVATPGAMPRAGVVTTIMLETLVAT